MEEYRRFLCSRIGFERVENGKEIEDIIRNNKHFVANRNEDERLHSHYLGDRYEPALIYNGHSYTYHYYLFDGEIKDCIHPFCIGYDLYDRIDHVGYYSSKRIKLGEPISIWCQGTNYNIFNDREILDGYLSRHVSESNDLSTFNVLCDEIEDDSMFSFSFTD